MAYDFVVVGAGMFGATFARMAADRGRKVLVIDTKLHIGGMCYTEPRDGVIFHRYGPHVFHTNSAETWAFVNRFARFRPFIVRTKAFYQKRVYSLPFSMMFFHQVWGVVTPEEARKKLIEVRIPIQDPKTVEEWALSQLGNEIYEKFIHHYTRKQWGRDPATLPAAILRRLPIRLTYDDNYFDDRWQGIPEGGYTPMFERMLEGIEVRLGVDYFDDRDAFERMGRVVYSGRVDRFFGYEHGDLEFRSCRFETRSVEGDYQGNAVFHYVEPEPPFTRVIEHKHFDDPSAQRSSVTWEYPFEGHRDDEPLYPVNDRRNGELYAKYAAMPKTAIFAGRLGSYRYFDMCEVIAQARKLCDDLA
jgi:UDP-galactopyranose mutase